MAHNTKIYGFINGPTWRSDDFYRLHRLNASVISSLPEIDKEFPFINQSMFSIPDEQGIFRQQIITFGASYKTLEYEWDVWLGKFENILKSLYWWEAKIHADFELMGKYDYEWKTDPDEIGEKNWHADPPMPCVKWSFNSNGPRTFLDALNK